MYTKKLFDASFADLCEEHDMCIVFCISGERSQVRLQTLTKPGTHLTGFHCCCSDDPATAVPYAQTSMGLQGKCFQLSRDFLGPGTPVIDDVLHALHRSNQRLTFGSFRTHIQPIIGLFECPYFIRI